MRWRDVAVILIVATTAVAVWGQSADPESAPPSSPQGRASGEEPLPSENLDSEGVRVPPNDHARNYPLTPEIRRKIKNEGFLRLWEAVASGKANKPMMRRFHRLYQRLSPFEYDVPADWRAKALAFERTMPASGGFSAGTSGGVEPDSVPAAGRWFALGPANIPGRITGLALHPTDSNTLYAGAADGGVWKTTDGGLNWTALTDFKETLSIGSVVVDPNNANTVYAGTGEGNFSFVDMPGYGVLKSTDAGATWTLGPYFASVIRKLAIHASDSNALYAAAQGGLFKTTNGGASWTKLTGGLPTAADDHATDVIIHPTTPSTVYCAFGAYWGPAGNGVYRSTDSGANWTKLGGGLPTVNVGRIALAMAPSNSSILFAGIQDSSTYQLLGLYKTTNGGTSWSNLSATPNYCSTQCWYDNVIAVDPGNANIVYAGGIDIYRTTNGGNAWSRMTDWWRAPSDSKYVHADQHAFLAPVANKIWAGCDGGVSLSTDAGVNWSVRSGGMENTQFYSIAMHPTAPATTYGGTQDNGTHRYYGAKNTWVEVYGGDGGFTAVDFNNPNRVYTEYVYLDFLKSENGGGSWCSATDGINSADRVLFIAPFIMDPANPSVMYAGTYRVYRTANAPGLCGGGGLWSAISGDLTAGASGKVSALAVSPAATATLWAGSSDGLVWVSTNTGGAWSNVTKSPLPASYVSRLVAHPTDANSAYATYTHYNAAAGRVFKTNNLGASWTDISSGLPAVPATGLFVDPDNPLILVVGTDLGIYRSVDGGASWSKWSNEFPNVAVEMFDYEPALKILRAATHGRGIWEFAPAPPPVPDGKVVSGTPMTVAINGSNLDLTWDASPSNCAYLTYQFLYGDLANVASYALAGATCLGRALTGTASVPAPGGDVFFYVASANRVGDESAAGFDSNGALVAFSGVGACGVSARVTGGACP